MFLGYLQMDTDGNKRDTVHTVAAQALNVTCRLSSTSFGEQDSDLTSRSSDALSTVLFPDLLVRTKTDSLDVYIIALFFPQAASLPNVYSNQANPLPQVVTVSGIS